MVLCGWRRNEFPFGNNCCFVTKTAFSYCIQSSLIICYYRNKSNFHVNRGGIITTPFNILSQQTRHTNTMFASKYPVGCGRKSSKSCWFKSPAKQMMGISKEMTPLETFLWDVLWSTLYIHQISISPSVHPFHVALHALTLEETRHSVTYAKPDGGSSSRNKAHRGKVKSIGRKGGQGETRNRWNSHTVWGHLHSCQKWNCDSNEKKAVFSFIYPPHLRKVMQMACCRQIRLFGERGNHRDRWDPTDTGGLTGWQSKRQSLRVGGDVNRTVMESITSTPFYLNVLEICHCWRCVEMLYPH